LSDRALPTGDSLLADGPTVTARFDIQGVRLVVRCNDAAAMGHVQDTYGWFADRSTDADRRPGRSVDVAYLSDPGGGATVIDAEGRRSHWRPDDEPLVALFDAIVAGVIAALSADGILAIHAGVVALDGRAILVAGRSGRGKTTLVLGMLRRGLDLLSDELALIGPDQRTVLAYPRGLHIRPQALELFPELGFLAEIEPHELGGGSEWSVGPDALGRAFGTAVAGSARLDAVVLLDGDPIADATPELEPVRGAMAAMELLRGTPSAAWDFDGVLARLPRIVSDVPCARLRSARLDETVDAVLAWAADAPSAAR
jgi:hypothetical protein